MTIRVEVGLYADVARAREELGQHVRQIVLKPDREGTRRYYVATGEWNLTGDIAPEGGGFELVAGAGFEPATFGL